MNLSNDRYSKFALAKEMLETADVVRSFNQDSTKKFAESVANKKGMFLTGEGSSRIFPAKRAMYAAMKDGQCPVIITEGSTQAMEYKLDDYAVFGASNSGQTKEVVRLFMQLKESNHDAFFGLTANKNTKLEEISLDSHVLNCGKEYAVAATKSVVEQGLFFDSILHNIKGEKMADLEQFAKDITAALTLEIDPAIIEKMQNADVIYWAGRNTGVVEELTLKTNEITRKKSEFLEGTYAVHGIEEVMDKKEVVIWVNPFEAEEEMFTKCLVDGIGMDVIAISTKQTSLPTIVIPENKAYNEYIELCAGWNVMVEIGTALGIDLDKPERARKVGNEFVI